MIFIDKGDICRRASSTDRLDFRQRLAARRWRHAGFVFIGR